MSVLKVFIVSSNRDVIQQLEAKLRSDGFQVFVVERWDKVIDRILRSQPDLVVLDRKLIDFDGLELCRMIRKNVIVTSTPIILLTDASNNQQDIITAYECGADDYIVKPFNTDIVIARIKAILRRLGRGNEAEDDVVSIQGIVVNRTRHFVHIDNELIQLTPKEFDLLYVLMKKRGRILTREVLCECVWGYEYFGTTRTVDYHIGQLRQKLGRYADKIKTIETLGYLFE